MVLFNRPDLILPPDISLNFFKCPFNILFNLKIRMQGTQIAFQFHLSFQKMRDHKLLDSFFLLTDFFGRYCVLFFLLFGRIY